jgi:acetyl-CoA carboxylase biotin carboxyl carrier protein
MALTHDDVRNILKLIDESRFESVDLEIGDLKLSVRKGSGELPAAPMAPNAEVKPVVAPPQPPRRLDFDGQTVIPAPMVGTFYRAPSPGEPPFVEAGQKVAAGETVGLVEVMKLFNSITAPCAGTIVEFLVENGKLVEYGQPLLTIEPEVG